MLVTASIAAAALIVAAVSLSRVDYRELYNEMYPVEGLKRDVLGLCHQAKATFVRALQSDRVNCYDGMPDAVDIAIGWVRTSDRLAALRHPPTPVDLAERVLAEAIVRGRVGVPELRHFTGFVASPAAVRPCPAAMLAALTDSDERLARRLRDGGGSALAAFGIASASARETELPALPLAGAGHAAAPALSLGDAAARGASPSPPSAGCRAPA